MSLLLANLKFLFTCNQVIHLKKQDSKQVGFQVDCFPLSLQLHHFHNPRALGSARKEIKCRDPPTTQARISLKYRMIVIIHVHVYNVHCCMLYKQYYIHECLVHCFKSLNIQQVSTNENEHFFSCPILLTCHLLYCDIQQLFVVLAFVVMGHINLLHNEKRRKVMVHS